MRRQVEAETLKDRGDDFVRREIDLVVMDAWQYYNVAHDLTHLMARMAAERASAQLGRRIPVVDYPTVPDELAPGAPLSRVPAGAWRARLAGAFQDFVRFELRAREAIGLGDLPRLDDIGAVRGAVTRAGADDVIERLPSGLDTQLGPSWPGGVDVSFGQWQKIALARGFMREQPLLLALDEPTAALDAETEHALFERYAAAARGDQITLLVSHRFSTVRMADTIVVLDGARVVETGSHEQLMARGGQYAELYGIQAAAYR